MTALKNPPRQTVYYTVSSSKRYQIIRYFTGYTEALAYYDKKCEEGALVWMMKYDDKAVRYRYSWVFTNEKNTNVSYRDVRKKNEKPSPFGLMG